MASLLGAGAAIVGGLFSKKAKDKQGKAERLAGIRAGRTITEGGERAAGFFDPFAEAGGAASASQANLLGLGDDAAGDEAFRRFQESSGFQSQLRAGSQAITGNQASRGLLSSGSTLKRLSTFGSDLAKQGFSSFLGQLGGVAQRGLGAAQGQAQAISSSSRAAATAVRGGQVESARLKGEGTAGLISGFGQAAQIGLDEFG